MEAIPKPEAHEETIEVNPNEVVDVEELTPEQLKELVEADDAAENPIAFKSIAMDVIGVAAGFLAFDYINVQILNTLASNGVSMTQQNLLIYSGLILLGEIVLAYILMHKVKGKARGFAGFIDPFALGMIAAGVRTFFVAVMAYTTPLGYPAVNQGVGRALVPANRVVGT